jgi:hypothetical protein
MTEPYPRDLIGYGADPPHPRWPEGARLALSIVLNYEEGGEHPAGPGIEKSGHEVAREGSAGAASCHAAADNRLIGAPGNPAARARRRGSLSPAPRLALARWSTLSL